MKNKDGQTWEKQLAEEYELTTKGERELAIMIFDIYRKYFQDYVAAHGDWNAMPHANKLVWIRTAQRIIDAFVGQDTSALRSGLQGDDSSGAD